jgi:uncharacterized LabA/DUF88 family protein
MSLVAQFLFSSFNKQGEKVRFVVLLDGGFIKSKFFQAFRHEPTAAEIKTLSDRIVSYSNKSGDELIRIYYYDSPPLDKKVPRPISGTLLDFGKTPAYAANKQRLSDLKQTDYFAVREGRLTSHGWKLKPSGIGKSTASLTDADFSPDIRQKGVDMKIGLDIAWISLDKIADRILVVTGDSDFIPALKLARRNGVQVYLFTLGHGISPELREHSDRLITNSISTL